jgi:hypothetical protein
VLDIAAVSAYAGSPALPPALWGPDLLLHQACSASSASFGKAAAVVDGNPFTPLTTASGDLNAQLSCSVGGSARPQVLVIAPNPQYGNRLGRLCNATVALEQLPAEGHVFIKDWSENSGMLASLQAAGVIGDVVRVIPTGFVVAHEVPLLMEV